MDRVRPASRSLSADALPERVGRLAFWLMLALGALDVWFFRNWNLNPDGVSYFDLGRAVAAHGPAAAINGYWSPLYPIVIGALLKLARPSAAWMYPLVRALTYLLFVATTVAFARLLRVACAHSAAYQSVKPWVRATAIGVFWEAYALLVLKAVGLGLVTPDMGVTFVVFWAGAALLQLAAARRSARWWLRLGAVLAVGYWWKAILFPVGGVVLLVAFGIAWWRQDSRRGPLWAAGVFGLLSLVLIVPVSRLTGRPTFGETGRLNQLWFVNAGPHLTTLCVTPGYGLPLDRAKAVRTDSVLTGTPLTCAQPDRWPEATLPLWYDASWWYQQTHVGFEPMETVRAVGRNIGYLRDALGAAAPWFTVAMLAVGAAALVTLSTLGLAWPLAALSAISIAFYLLVYVELRHVVPFLVALVIAGTFALLAKADRWRRVLLSAVAVIGLADVVVHVRLAVVELAIMRHEMLGDPRPQQLSARVARLLAERGLQPGERIATVNTLWNVDWAQRGGFVVRAYVPEYTVSIARTFQELSDPCVRATWTAALARARIDAAVALVPEGFAAPSGFEPLGDTGYHLLRVRAGPMPASCATH